MTTIRLLKNGAEIFPAMLSAVDRAASCIALEMYIFADDETGREFCSRLTDAARRGVRVKVLVDAFGSWPLPDSFWDGLRAAGGMVRWFRPHTRAFLMFRNHRKLLLVDDRIAYVGGFNIANEYYRGREGGLPWRDNAIEVTGAEVSGLRRSFSRMWARANLPLRGVVIRLYRDRTGRGAVVQKVRFLESGPENPMLPVRRAYRLLIHSAEKGIDLAMSYFYPHGSILRALKRAVRRGARVRLMFPRKSDVRIARWAAQGLYGRLLRAGMEVWEYTPTMMHAKLAIVDDTVIAGSANLDIRSGRINYELVAVLSDAELAAQARRDFEDDLGQSVRIRYEDWKKRSLIQRIREWMSYFLLARLDIFFARAELERWKRRKVRR